MAAQDRLSYLLGLVYAPSASPAEKRAAEAELQALSRSPEALEWALGTLQSHTTDLQALFFACTCADEAAVYRWRRLTGGQQAALRSCLWRCVAEPGAPHFVRSKLCSTLAHVACLDWPAADPDFWPSLQACLADPARIAVGIDLLTATVDHFHSLALTTSAGLRGKVRPTARCLLQMVEIPCTVPPTPPHSQPLPVTPAGPLLRHPRHPTAVPRAPARGFGHTLLPAA